MPSGKRDINKMKQCRTAWEEADLYWLLFICLFVIFFRIFIYLSIYQSISHSSECSDWARNSSHFLTCSLTCRTLEPHRGQYVLPPPPRKYPDKHVWRHDSRHYTDVISPLRAIAATTAIRLSCFQKKTRSAFCLLSVVDYVLFKEVQLRCIWTPLTSKEPCPDFSFQMSAMPMSTPKIAHRCLIAEGRAFVLRVPIVVDKNHYVHYCTYLLHDWRELVEMVVWELGPPARKLNKMKLVEDYFSSS